MSRVAGPVSRAELRSVAPSRPLVERQRLLVRFETFPWDRVLPVFHLEESVLDVGCGPGLLAYLLSRAGARGSYLGIDLDAGKIAHARRWPGEDVRTAFRVAKVEEIPRSSFRQVALLDVLSSVPQPGRHAFLAATVRRVAPGGRFVSVTRGGGPPWKRAVETAQGLVTGRVLRIRPAAATVPCDGAEMEGYLRSSGLEEIEVRGIGHGYLHGFELITARMPG